MKDISPGKYGLPSQTKLIEIKKGHIAVEKNRKARIIMKDGEAILKTAEKIRSAEKNTQISLMTNASVCSKTRSFLKKHNIDIIPID